MRHFSSPSTVHPGRVFPPALLSLLVLAIWSLSDGPAQAVPPPGQAAEQTPAAAGNDNDEAAEDEEKKAPEIPPPPADNLTLPDDVPADVKKQFDEAVALYETARKRFPSGEEANKEAVRAFKRLQRKLTESPLPGYYLGILHQLERDFSKARRALGKAIKLSPDFYEAHVELGDVAVWERKREKALEHYERALEVYPHYEYGVDRITMVLIELGRFEEARPFLERALLRGSNPARERFRQAVDFATKDPDWGTTFTTESEHYVVKTNALQEVADEISENIELVRELYDQVFPDIGKSDRKYLILMFKDRASYMQAGGPANSGGAYYPLARRIMIPLQNDMAQTLVVLKHEGFHEYCHEYLENIPSWFNEGLADYFAASQLTRHRGKRIMNIRPSKNRLNVMVTVFNRDVPHPTVPELMNMTQAQMYDMRNGNKNMGLHYCQAWSICYFCIESGNRKYQKAMKEYFKAVRRGKTQTQAYQLTFARLDMNKFEEEWESFIQRTYSTDRGI